ncbi:C40 family peptidase [Planktothrix sp. FACHB-1355]|uniref:C40 family peptidase n=1 Tax=Aerosakkonema funiforme FACHB-1375 TaxID=2949571 RepID=A0A926ZGG5_9CYAN|nr:MULTISPECIES: NlpC/P60 family protein [Oscillatoriales]MBD2179781.1 C40 family peptidase [Aerosakkonema funiforme FACHB-1375]MBD3560019.1 C40 family peptidase [Planktothrix sp. FACHB-1355]
MRFPKIKRWLLFLLWSWAWFLLIVLLIYPISYGIFRLITVLLCLYLWLGALFLFWNKNSIRYLCFLLALIVSGIIILPGYQVDGSILRQKYVQELSYYEGSLYVWGGENKFGIDCSGLVRRGLINANLKMGLLSFNSKLLREAFLLWWYDASAEALGKEYRNWTKFLYKAPSINELDNSKIQTGDIAVTTDGLHILAYIGNNVWIEADPNYQKVIKVKVPDASNIWFRVPVNILEWRQFETG